MSTPTIRAPGAAEPITIVLVDDHGILRQGLRSVLERDPQLRVVGEAASSAEAMAVVSRTRPDIVLLDLKLSSSSDIEGLALCQQLTSTYTGVAVLVLTTFLQERAGAGHPRGQPW